MQMLVILPFTHCQLCSVIDIYIQVLCGCSRPSPFMGKTDVYIYRFIIVNILQQEHLSLPSHCRLIFGLKKSGISTREPVSTEIFFYLFKSQERNGALFF